MANYYHEARAHARAIKTLQDDNKRKAERRAEFAVVQVLCIHVFPLLVRLTLSSGHPIDIIELFSLGFTQLACTVSNILLNEVRTCLYFLTGRNTPKSPKGGRESFQTLP